jgi:hypothetical protein
MTEQTSNLLASVAKHGLEMLTSEERQQASSETERFFEERRKRADREAFRSILDREGGEPPRPEDTID